jgi:hypothetical protein
MNYANQRIARGLRLADVLGPCLSDLGLTGTAQVRDLWAHTNLGSFSGSFQRVLSSHAMALCSHPDLWRGPTLWSLLCFLSFQCTVRRG